MAKKKTLTTAAGIPVPDNQTSLTAGNARPHPAAGPLPDREAGPLQQGADT